jgi:hypothetical protein
MGFSLAMDKGIVFSRSLKETPMEGPIDIKPEVIGYRVSARDGTITHLLALPSGCEFVSFMKTSDDVVSCVHVPAGPTGNRPLLLVKTRKGTDTFTIELSAYGPPGQPVRQSSPRQIDYARITEAVSVGWCHEQ